MRGHPCSLCGCPGAHFCTGRPSSGTGQWSLPASKVDMYTSGGTKKVHRVPLVDIFLTGET